MRRSLALLVPLALALGLTGCPDADDDDSAAPVDDSMEPLVPEPWPWCPPASVYQGTGEATLEVGPDTVYCATFNEGRELRDELAAKAMVRLVEGSYPIPDVDGITAMALPMCAQVEAGQAGAITDGPGELDTATDLGGGDRYRLQLDQPLLDPDDAPWQVTLWVQGPREHLEGSGVVTLDGGHLGLATDPLRVLAGQLCPWLCDDFASGVRLDSCTFAGVTTSRSRVEFDGGWIELHLRIGQVPLATQPGLFTTARGELDGVAWSQRSYWKLLYNPTHHHFNRDFLVLLDEPVGGVHGVEVIEVDPTQQPPPTQVFVVDDEMVRIEQRAVTGETFVSPVE
jgi:hypothetical protein